MGKKNLDSIIIKNDKVLPPKVKAKAKKENETKVITMKITESEFQNIRDKAGELVPISTFIKHHIRTKTDLFSKTTTNEK
ncbi:MAG: hypothetical protein MGF17_08900 [Trichodesmium sp. MAG_R04]|jgi:ribosomal protein L18E|nr:hypothetical protein [Trichodesmium sp. MAG_R04]